MIQKSGLLSILGLCILLYFLNVFFRNVLQIDGPYNESFYEKLLDRSSEDDGTIAYALAKVPYKTTSVLLIKFFKSIIYIQLYIFTISYAKALRFC